MTLNRFNRVDLHSFSVNDADSPSEKKNKKIIFIYLFEIKK